MIHFIRDIVLIITGIIVSISSILILFLMLRMFKEINKTIRALSWTSNRLDELTNKIIKEITFPVLKISSGLQKVRAIINSLINKPSKDTEK